MPQKNGNGFALIDIEHLSDSVYTKVTLQTSRHECPKQVFVSYASINENDIQAVLIQLMALKLIKTDTIKSEYDGVYTYWVLSQYGRTEMVRLKAIRRDNNSSTLG